MRSLIAATVLLVVTASTHAAPDQAFTGLLQEAPGGGYQITVSFGPAKGKTFKLIVPPTQKAGKLVGHIVTVNGTIHPRMGVIEVFRIVLVQ